MSGFDYISNGERRVNLPSDEKPLLKCPFCDEWDFDKIGLKIHLISGHCDAFENSNRLLSKQELEAQERLDDYQSILP